MWSLGCVLFCIGTRESVAFSEPDRVRYCDGVQSFNHRNLSINLGKDGISLIQKLLSPDPDQRPNATEALLHPWFHGSATVSQHSIQIPPASDLSAAEKSQSTSQHNYNSFLQPTFSTESSIDIGKNRPQNRGSRRPSGESIVEHQQIYPEGNRNTKSLEPPADSTIIDLPKHPKTETNHTFKRSVSDEAVIGYERESGASDNTARRETITQVGPQQTRNTLAIDRRISHLEIELEECRQYCALFRGMVRPEILRDVDVRMRLLEDDLEASRYRREVERAKELYDSWRPQVIGGHLDDEIYHRPGTPSRRHVKELDHETHWKPAVRWPPTAYRRASSDRDEGILPFKQSSSDNMVTHLQSSKIGPLEHEGDQISGQSGSDNRILSHFRDLEKEKHQNSIRFLTPAPPPPPPSRSVERTYPPPHLRSVRRTYSPPPSSTLFSYPQPSCLSFQQFEENRNKCPNAKKIQTFMRSPSYKISSESPDTLNLPNIKTGQHFDKYTGDHRWSDDRSRHPDTQRPKVGYELFPDECFDNSSVEPCLSSSSSSTSIRAYDALGDSLPAGIQLRPTKTNKFIRLFNRYLANKTYDDGSIIADCGDSIAPNSRIHEDFK